MVACIVSLLFLELQYGECEGKNGISGKVCDVNLRRFLLLVMAIYYDVTLTVN